MPQALSTRSLSEQDAIMRMNREVIPVARKIAEDLSSLGFPVALASFTGRPLEQENLEEYCKRELLPLFTAIFSQTNALASTMATGKIGSRSPTDVQGLVVWMNRTVLPKLMAAKRVVDIATP